MSLFIHKENQTLLWQLIHETPLWPAFEQVCRSHTELWFRNIISQFYDKYWEKYSIQPMSVSDLKQINKEIISFMVADIKKTISPSIVQPVVSTFPEQSMISVSVSAKPGELPDALKSVRIEKESETTVFNQTILSRIAEYDKPPSSSLSSSSAEIIPANTVSPPSAYQQLAESYNVEKEKEEKVKKAQKEFDDFQRRYSAGFERKPPPPIDFSEQLDSEKIKNMDELIQRQMAEREKDLEGIPLANIQ
jgi:hypothetical protein